MEMWAKRVRRRSIITVAATGALFLIIYLAVIPTVVANRYLSKLDAQTAAVKSKLHAVSSESGLTIFSDPDIPLEKRQAAIDKALHNIQEARAGLADLERSNMLSRLPGNGFAGGYHTAVVRQERAGNIVQQSRQVLDQYAKILNFLSAYTNLQIALDSRLATINKVKDLNSFAGQGTNMANTARLVRADQKTLLSLAAPPDFAPLQQAAADTFAQTASGFDRLARGLNRAVDSHIDGGVAALEAAAEKNQVTDKELLVRVAVSSSVLRQLAELPEKVEHAQGR